jgi:hypothetical protein
MWTRQVLQIKDDIEMCLRNEHDKFVASKTSWYQESQQPCDAKDLGLT